MKSFLFFVLLLCGANILFFTFSPLVHIDGNGSFFISVFFGFLNLFVIWGNVVFVMCFMGAILYFYSEIKEKIFLSENNM